MDLTESVEKLPRQLVIPNDQIQLSESIGQGESCAFVNLSFVRCSHHVINVCLIIAIVHTTVST